MRTNLRNNLKSILFLTFIVFCFNQSFAQETEITGTVTTVTGEPIPFANILIKGTSQGTSADFDGIYTLELLIPEGNWEYKVVLNNNWDQLLTVIVAGGQAMERNKAICEKEFSRKQI